MKRFLTVISVAAFIVSMFFLLACDNSIKLTESECKKIQYTYFNQPEWHMCSPDNVVMEREFKRLKEKFDEDAVAMIVFNDIKEKGEKSVNQLKEKSKLLNFPSNGYVYYFNDEIYEDNKYNIIYVKKLQSLTFNDIAEWVKRSDVVNVCITVNNLTLSD